MQSSLHKENRFHREYLETKMIKEKSFKLSVTLGGNFKFAPVIIFQHFLDLTINLLIE